MIQNLGVYTILICGALVWVNDYFELSWPGSLALLLFGLWLIAWGVEVAVKGGLALVKQGQGRFDFLSGVPDGLWSAIFITFGLGLAGYGGVELASPGKAEKFLSQALNSPSGTGVLIGIIGFMITANGVIRLLSENVTAKDKPNRLEEAEFKIAGIWHILVGVVLISLALGLILAPGLLNMIFNFVLDIVKHLILNWLS